jgi:hypothetical protein
MSDHQPITDTFEPDLFEPGDDLPRRPRRRPVTPVTVALAAVLIGALGFIGGVQVQKRSAPTTAAAALRGSARQGTGQGGFAPGGGGQAAGATVGQVANVKGSTIYLTDADGNTIRVRTNSNSKVTRTAVSTPGAVHPGDTVIVQGTTSKSGTVTASQIVATARNASGARGALGSAGAGGAATTPGDPTP